MKGTAVTAEQYDAARRFVFAVETRPVRHHRQGDDAQVMLRFGDLVGLLAWYGGLRYIAGRDGIASLECPGEAVVVPPTTATTEPTV